MGLIPVLFLRPKHFILDTTTRIMLDLPSERSAYSVGAEMCHHLQILPQVLYNLIRRFAKLFLLGLRPFMSSQCPGVKMNRCIRPVCVLWSLVCILPTLFVVVAWGSICLICFLLSSAFHVVALSPLWNLVSFCLPNILIHNLLTNCICGSASRPLKVVIFVLNVLMCLLLIFYNYFMLYTSCSFIVPSGS